MNFNLSRRLFVIACAFPSLALQAVAADDAQTQSKGESALAIAATQEKYTFVMFWRENNAGTKEFAGKVKSAVASHADKATWMNVNITDAAERSLVQRFGVARAPMPLAMVVAPNGAITGVFPQKFDETKVEPAFVTPTMMRCMKSLQEGKLVLVSLQSSGNRALSFGAKQFQEDEMFRDRTVVVPLPVEDPAEERFLRDLQLNNASIQSTSVALLAPPGMLIGKFTPTTSKDEIAAALHAAGKCCNDPNCKHNQQKGQAQPRTGAQGGGGRQ